MKAKITIALCCLLSAAAGADGTVNPALRKKLAHHAIPLPPEITQASCKCLPGTGEFEVRGKRFGSSQGSRVLRVNGAALPTVLIWQKDFIRCGHTYDFPGGEIVHVAIFDTEKNERVSNVFDCFVPFCIYNHSPAGVLKAKSTVVVLAKPDVGASAWGRKVMVGDMEAHAEWLGNKIKILVPLLDPGPTTLRLEKDGQVISNGYAVTVQ